MKWIKRIGLTALMMLAIPVITQAGIEDSVVKIVNQSNSFDWYTPWDSGSTGGGTGSGFVISGKRILTNAHVVSDSAMLLIYFHNDPTPYPARVLAIGHDCDLALLELNDSSRMESVKELQFNGLPLLRTQVITYGYPAGGKLLSSTAGVVSRIEMKDYVHSGLDMHLSIQTDAAINPGNSGGPVIQNGAVVGVAFQGSQQLENMGFFIPTYVVDHFLTDLKDGTYDGYPEIGIFPASLDSPAARRYAGMNADETGIRVETLMKGCSADSVLKKNDIITSLNGYPVANDGTVLWNGLRLDSGIIMDGLQKGDSLEAGIIRNKERRTVTIELSHYNPFPAKANIYDRKPEYYVYGGLVFVPLNRKTISTYSNSWVQKAPQELVYEMYYRYLIEDKKIDTPQVMIIRRLEHQVNSEESFFSYNLIDTINGKETRTIADIISAVEGNTNDQHIIRFQYGDRLMALDRKAADKANAEILENYAIPKDRNL